MFDVIEQLPTAPDAPDGVPVAPDRKGPDWVVDSIMYCLTAPFIGYTGWEDVVSRHKDRIILTRLGHGLVIAETQQATEFETMLYLSSASLTAPMQSHWVDIYLHLFLRCFPGELATGTFLATELNPDQVADLARLRRWIYNTQIEHLKAKWMAGKESDIGVVAEEVKQFKLFE